MLSVNGFRAALKYLTMFKEGMICTVSLSFLTVVFGFLLALVLALMRMSRIKPLSIFASIYVEVFRATPMLVQLFIIYYIVFGGVSLPSFKLFGFIRFERFLPGVISLALNSAAYLSEIIRAGIQSIDPGQSEAARSLPIVLFACSIASCLSRSATAIRRSSSSYSARGSTAWLLSLSFRPPGKTPYPKKPLLLANSTMVSPFIALGYSCRPPR